MPYLAFNLYDGNEFVFDILEKRLSIGRDSNNELVIDNTYISSFHAELIWKSEGKYEVVDLQSANGTFVNGQRIERCEVRFGDKIRFGQLDAQFREHASKDDLPVSLPQHGLDSKNTQAPSAGRRGDTESIPVQDLPAERKTQIQAFSHDRDGACAPNESASSPCRESEEHLNHLRSEILELKKELQSLSQDKLATSAALERVQGDRNTASAQLDKLRAEYNALQKSFSETQRDQEAALKVQQMQADEAEARLKELTAKAALADHCIQELAERQKQLSEVSAQCKETEKLRQDAAHALEGLEKQKEALKSELTTLEERILAGNAQIHELANQVNAEEIRAAEVRANLHKATAALSLAEMRRNEAETAAANAREEDKTLRKSIPAMRIEMAELQAALTKLTHEHDEASQYVTRLNLGSDESQKKITLLQQQISQLEEAQRLREERLMKAQADVDAEATRLKTVQEKTAEAETVLNTIEKELRESRSRADSSRTQVTLLDADLKARLDQIETLKLEEARLFHLTQSHSTDIHAAKTLLDEIQGKICLEEKRLSDYTQVGGQILSLGDSLARLETRYNEISRSVSEATERELALQIKISALQETCAREQHRLEQIRKDGQRLGSPVGHPVTEEPHHRLASLNRQIQDQLAQSERLKNEIAMLRQRRAEFALAESQIKHWQEIECRMRSQLHELEEKHEIMRRCLPLHEGTLIALAHDLIKRMDGIDTLASHHAGENRGDVVAQLLTVKASFEDLLFHYGVRQINFAAGTEVDPQMRPCISIVDSIPGEGKARVVQTCRVGYAYSCEDGREVILRKVEVRTSSQSG